MNRFVTAAVVGLLPLSVSSLANADGAGSFGAEGQIAILSDLQLSIDHVIDSPPEGSSRSRTTVVVQPALDYFVIENLSIGGSLFVSHTSPEDGESSTGFGVAPRVGYNIALNDVLSFWPKASLAYSRLSIGDFAGYKFAAGVFAPLMIHPAEHFFIGIGPNFSTDLISKVEGNDSLKTTNIGVRTVVGGYF